jgi:hypothetical protein
MISKTLLFSRAGPCLNVKLLTFNSYEVQTLLCAAMVLDRQKQKSFVNWEKKQALLPVILG